MIVCVCRRVSDRDIEREVRDGCTSFDALQAELLVGTACGACTDCARKTFESQCLARHGQACAAPGIVQSFAPSLLAAPG
jgi:bacterioferritin-associated ferredoxin